MSTDTDTQTIARADPDQARAALAHYISTGGDVSKMNNAQRAAFILDMYRRIGLNPSSGALEIVEFYDPETKSKVAKVYPKAIATQQLGNLHRVRIETLSEQMVGSDMFKVTVRGHQPDGRTYDEVGYVSLIDRNGHRLVGDRYRNALMKCHTVAKRRLILGMIGLSAPPEGGRRIYLGADGAMLDNPTEEDKYLNDNPAVAAISGRSRFETMPPAVETGLDGLPDQQPRPADLEYPERPPSERPTFRPSENDVKRWLGAWFAAVKGTSLDSDDARHRFMRQYSSEFPAERQTESLRAFLSSCTERQAGELLAYVRALVDDERRAIAAADVVGEDDESEQEPF